MPSNELEEHPFLLCQKGTDTFNVENVKLAIIGTFPIYEITYSEPIENVGIEKRNRWNNKANFQFFYGSKQNNFWDILCNCIGTNIPDSVQECLRILNSNGIYISDTIQKTFRTQYSPSDNQLSEWQLNTDMREMICSMMNHNLNTIIFTSTLAKALFCRILNITDNGKIQYYSHANKQMVLKTLPSPAGNGRSVPHYTVDYPLTNEEELLKKSGKPYTKGYRQRIYCESISYAINR